MSRLYKNWTVHNMIGHPLAQCVFLVAWPLLGKDGAANLSARVHDITVPHSKEKQ